MSNKSDYWKSSLKIVGSLLICWFLVSFGAAILFRDQLDTIKIGQAPLGFWMAQQGSIICFVIILIIYTLLMNKLDQKHHFEDEDK